MSDLTAFLGARLDEDEAITKEAARCDGAWPHGEWTPEHFAHAEFPAELDAHIARHDPARALREVEAKRAILAAHPIRPISNGTCEACSAPDGSSYLGGLEEFIDWPCPTLRALAAIWRDHPDYPWRGHEGGPP